jgi:hypothetical protein
LKPHLKKMWCIPPKQSAEFVCHMEDVLEVYHWPYDPKRPVVCLDETFKQLVGETREPLPMLPGQPHRYDHVYVRNGVASLFMAFEPLAGWREVTITAQRRRQEFAHVVRDLLEGRYKNADKVVLVLDQLNTHSASSFYEAFPPTEAKRLIERLEIHHTPKHGSWLNMAEIELSALGRQCLSRRIPTVQRLHAETKAWEQTRNQRKLKVNWQFTTKDARIKLRALYPSING